MAVSVDTCSHQNVVIVSVAIWFHAVSTKTSDLSLHVSRFHSSVDPSNSVLESSLVWSECDIVVWSSSISNSVTNNHVSGIEHSDGLGSQIEGHPLFSH